MCTVVESFAGQTYRRALAKTPCCDAFRFLHDEKAFACHSRGDRHTESSVAPVSCAVVSLLVENRLQNLGKSCCSARNENSMLLSRCRALQAHGDVLTGVSLCFRSTKLRCLVLQFCLSFHTTEYIDIRMSAYPFNCATVFPWNPFSSSEGPAVDSVIR